MKSPVYKMDSYHRVVEYGVTSRVVAGVRRQVYLPDLLTPSR